MMGGSSFTTTPAQDSLAVRAANANGVSTSVTITAQLYFFCHTHTHSFSLSNDGLRQNPA